ncbi:MAG: hypothetical protein ACRDMA_16665 [Solirubrobacterales bacterium]
MEFRVEWSEGGGIEGPWQELDTANTQSDDEAEAGLHAVGQTGTLAGLYRVRPHELPDERPAYYFMDAGGRIERRHFPGLC